MQRLFPGCTSSSPELCDGDPNTDWVAWILMDSWTLRSRRILVSSATAQAPLPDGTGELSGVVELAEGWLFLGH